jgi:chromosomal replication initiation ATPase DnaA
MGGLVIDIELPDLELRRKIVLGRYVAMNSRDHSVVIPDEVLEFVANGNWRRPRA